MIRLSVFFVLPGFLVCLAPASLGAEEASAPPSLSLTIDGGRLTVEPLLDNAVRVRFTKGAKSAEPSLILSSQVAAPRVEVRETNEALFLALPRLLCRIDKRNGALHFDDVTGRPLLAEIPGTRRIKEALVQGEATWTVAQSFDSPETEALFGLGQFQDGFLNLRDLPRRLLQVNTQIAIPMLVSSRGFGLLWHNYGLTDFNPADESIFLQESDAAGGERSVEVTTKVGTQRETRRDCCFQGRFELAQAGRLAFSLDIGRKMARQWRVEIDGKTVVDFRNLWLPPSTSWFSELRAGTHDVKVYGVQGDRPVLRFREARAVTEFRSPVAEGIDYVFFAGTADQVIAAYRKLTGPAPLPPLWALGYIHCRERYKSQEELLQNAAEFRRRRLPLDVIVQDWQYWGRHGWNAMRFDEQHYPDPAAMVRDLHREKTHLMLSVWSKIDPRSALGKDFVDRRYTIPGTDWIDFFNPEAARFYWENFRSRLLPLGIDAWWLDATEPENDDLEGRRVFTGPGERFRNLYPLLVNRTVYEGLRRDDSSRRVFLLTRSAFPGQQRYAAATWSGDIGNDWETLRRQVCAGLNYSVTGLPWWTTDTGGFFRPGQAQYVDKAYHERFLRWLQFSTFCPLQRVHGYMSDTEPWRYGAFVEAEAARWLELRQRLLPYLYSEAARICFEGGTLLRPLVMDFPNDAEALSQKQEYMFGPAFLVAPVLEPAVATWPVFLPETPGGWYDFWTGERVSGGQTRLVAAPLERLPLHVRAGSILPLFPATQYAGELKAPPLELRLYPGKDADYTLYEDNGMDYSYETGACSRIFMRWDEKAGTLVLGARQGEFPSMITEREFRITWVRPGHGLGGAPEKAPDLIVHYSGEALRVERPAGAR